jgi:glucose/arabinose dehydrogenase
LCYLLPAGNNPQAATIEPWQEIPFSSFSRAKVFENKLYLADLSGKLFEVQENDDRVEILDISSQVLLSGFTGFLNFAFPPFFYNEPCIFLWYGKPSETSATTSVISVIPVDLEDKTPTGEELILFQLENPTDRHVGGFLEFALDGTLLFGFGDGSNASPVISSQDMNDFHGKILRYKVHPNKIHLGLEEEVLSIPNSNPFEGSPIFSLGHRQPFECTVLDKENLLSSPVLLCYENGANSWEELNFVQRGVNVGWPCHEGFEITNFDHELCQFPLENQRSPLLTYPHTSPSGSIENWNNMGNSISPGFIYKGVLTEFQNSLIFADLTGSVWIARTDDENGVRNRDWVFGNIPITGEVQLNPETTLLIGVFQNVDGEPMLNVFDFISFTTTLYFLHLDE